jgi:hypothetical protein
MPIIRNSKGEEYDVSDVDAANMHAADPSLTIVGDVTTSAGAPDKAPVARSATEATERAGVAPATAQEQGAYSHRLAIKDKTSVAGAALRGAASSVTLGLSDNLVSDDTLEADQAWHPISSAVGQIGGAFLPGLIGDEAGLASLAADPLEAERAASSLGSRFVYAGETEGRGLERGMAKAGEALDAAKAAPEVPADLASLDSKGLKSARESELANIEAARVPQRQALVDDLSTYRSQLKNDDKIFLATKGIKEAALPADAAGALKIQEIGARSFKADKQLTALLDNPIALAEKPETALKALQKQESAFNELAKREGSLREMFAADTSGERAAALDKLPSALERNRALQARIRELAAEPASERLAAIDSAKEALSMPAPPKSLAENMLGGSIMGHVAGAFSGLPIVGPMIGAKVGQLASDLVFGRLGKATAAAGARASKAVGSFLEVGKRAAPFAAPVLASRVLHAARFAPDRGDRPSTPATAPALAESFKLRSAELRSQTAPGPDGRAVMRPAARAEMAARLAPIRAVSPLLADRIETVKARAAEFLADRLPRYPDVAGVQVGPDKLAAERHGDADVGALRRGRRGSTRGDRAARARVDHARGRRGDEGGLPRAPRQHHAADPRSAADAAIDASLPAPSRVIHVLGRRC